MPDIASPGTAPIPHIAVTLVDLHPDCATITAYRTVGRRVSRVRAAVRLTAAGGVNVIDWQAPLGVTVSYRAEQFTANGQSLGYTTPISSRIDGITKAWVHNPLDPGGGMEVELGHGTAAEIDRPHELAYARASGRALATVTSGQRGGVTDSPLIFYTLTEAATEQAAEILGDPYTDLTGPPVICIRTPAAFNIRWPASLVAAAELKEQQVNQPAGGHTTRWIGTVTEVEEPAITLVTAVLSYDDIDAVFASYDEMDAAYLTYLERDRQYQFAGRSALLDDPVASSTYGSGAYGTGPYGS